MLFSLDFFFIFFFLPHRINQRRYIADTKENPLKILLFIKDKRYYGHNEVKALFSNLFIYFFEIGTFGRMPPCIRNKHIFYLGVCVCGKRKTCTLGNTRGEFSPPAFGNSDTHQHFLSWMNVVAGELICRKL